MPRDAKPNQAQRTGPQQATNDKLDALVAQVRTARKYAPLDATLVRGVLAAELAKGRNEKAAVKAAKTKLHQVTGAYQANAYQFGAPNQAQWLQRLAATLDDPTGVRQLCLEAMETHASTRERLPFLAEFYATLFSDLPPDLPAAPRILDLACGLNPLAQPWMPLPTGYTYWACDIDTEQAEFLNRFFKCAQLPASATTHDLVYGNLDALPQGDIVLLLKTIPCLEHLDKGIAARLLGNLRCRVAFVSFPTRSLGGRERGMNAHYSEHFTQIAPPGYAVRRYDFPNELVFRLDRG